MGRGRNRGREWAGSTMSHKPCERMNGKGDIGNGGGRAPATDRGEASETMA
jgi:hypothetical protein